MSRRHDLLGIMLTIGGLWLLFDLATTLSVRPLRTRGWEFCLPFFVLCLDSGHWTLAADLAIGLNLAGAYLLKFDGHGPNVHLHLSRIQVKRILVVVGAGVLSVLGLIWLLVFLDPLRWILG